MKELMDQMGMGEVPSEDNIKDKLEVLKELHDMASQLLEGELESPMEEEGMEEDMDMEDPMADMEAAPMEKVTVAAPDQEGLEDGLEMAQDVVAKKKKPSFGMT